MNGNNKTGSVHLILGPMYASKTTHLCGLIRRYSLINKKCIIIKYARDCRYSDKDDVLSTHDHQEAAKALPCNSLTDELLEEILNYDVIGIDEGQFFVGIDKFADALANKGKHVIISALNGTFERKEFGEISKLIPLCENITMLNSMCRECGSIAHYSKRTSDEKEVEVIGGEDKYIAVCRGCYFVDKK